MVVMVTVKSIHAHFLLDTGSSIDIINVDFVPKITPAVFVHPPRTPEISMVDGTSSAVYGEVDITVNMGDRSYPNKFSVMKCGSFDGILERPFLNKYKAKMDVAASTLLLTDADPERPPLAPLEENVEEEKPPNRQPVFVAMDTMIPPNSEMIATGCLKNLADKEILVEPLP